MSVNLYGNISGQNYTPHTINPFELAKTRSQEPSKLANSSFGKDMPAIKVDISEEGLRALHGSKLNGSANPFETTEEIKFMSEHQPMESFTNQFIHMMPKNYEMSESGEAAFTPHTVEEKETALVEGFKKLYQEVSKGYDEDKRVRYIEDSTSEDGFRKLTKEEELSILKMEFDDFVDSRFGDEKKAYEATVKQAIKDIQDTMRRLGKEPKGVNVDSVEEMPEGFADRLKALTSEYSQNHGLKLEVMNAFISTMKDSVKS